MGSGKYADLIRTIEDDGETKAPSDESDADTDVGVSLFVT